MSDAVRTSERRLALLVAVIVPLLVLCPTAASGTTVTVMVTGNGYSFYFSPSSVSIQPGDTVRWTWNSSGHSTTSGSPGMPDGLWDSGILNQGAVFTYTFNTAGSFPYYCTVHGACCGMTGIVMVNGSPTPTPTPAPHAAFFVGEMPLGNGVYYLQLVNGNVFGYYSYLTDPRWIYHFDMGFEYWFDANDGHNGIYFYDFAANTFFYTSQGFPFPYLYDFGLNTVLYYYPDLNNPGHYTANPRYFYDFATHQIITR